MSEGNIFREHALKSNHLVLAATAVTLVVVGSVALRNRSMSAPTTARVSSFRPDAGKASVSSPAEHAIRDGVAVQLETGTAAIQQPAETTVESGMSDDRHSKANEIPAKPARSIEAVAAKAPVSAPLDLTVTIPQGTLEQPTLQRLALSLVGSDPEADLIWTTSINDPLLPANERKDLIEDLNENGFPDPKHVTLDDVPLILSRINLIEQLAPASMDDVNAAAFAEAYKDLVEMLTKTLK